jgi:hypothetical protein
MEPIQDDIETVRALPYCTRYGVRLPLDEFTTAVGYTAHNECPPQRHVYIVEPAALDRLVAERDRLQAQVESLQAQVESLREERELDVRVATWEVRFNALEAERDRLKEKADYWERQYVIESENADDFHAERDRLREERGICAVCLRNQGTQGLVYINKAMYDDVLAERDRLIQALERVKDHAILVMAPQSVVDMIDEALTKKREA